ncbi:DUF2959 family protein [Natronogracilivirga saccharolytica]|uniref:DUF2959 family protein n=1 Tax=Natronogracilivirga saccharolytica TaxID=2812953 RepID=A0A8J7UW06_9BACT|nr:DUF2959 family protein [Natronogracilivirga saccharolytica]MBP3193985.1 DUF2959 family protein [Natronogracilivirga saccharolytica]
MKKIITPYNSFLLFSLAAVIAVAACSTTSMQRSEDVQSTMQTVDNDIKRIVVQLDATGASLDDLTRPGQSDLNRAFDLFSENASKTKRMERDFAKHAREMEEAGKAYFEKWDKNGQQYDNPDIQARSDERRAELAETYDKIAQNNVGVKEAFKEYVSDINEIEQFLSNDLTRNGIESITSISNNVSDNGAQLKSELQRLQSAIENARTEMRQN